MFSANSCIWFFNFLCYLNIVYGQVELEGISPTGIYNNCTSNIRITKVTGSVAVGQEPFYDESTGSVYFVGEKNPSTIERFEVDTGKQYTLKIESLFGCERANPIVPIKGLPGRYFFACNDKLSILTWNGKTSKNAYILNITKPDPDHSWPTYHMKSGKVAPNGDVFIYSDPAIEGLHGAYLYVINDGGQAKRVVSNFTYGSGCGFSRDGKWVYFQDLYRRYVYKGYFDERTSTVGSVRVLVDLTKFTDIAGTSDVMTVDVAGYLWITIFESSMIIKVHPVTGEVICSITMPTKGVLGITFGRCPKDKVDGKLRCLYVTSLQYGKNDGSGALYLVEGCGSWGVQGEKVPLRSILKYR